MLIASGALELTDIVRDPTLLCQPWVLHYFPGMTPKTFRDGDWSLSLYAGMWDFVKEQ